MQNLINVLALLILATSSWGEALTTDLVCLTKTKEYVHISLCPYGPTTTTTIEGGRAPPPPHHNCTTTTTKRIAVNPALARNAIHRVMQLWLMGDMDLAIIIQGLCWKRFVCRCGRCCACS
jgi:hypothetical protein